MSLLKSEIHFLSLVAYGKNETQITYTIKQVNNKQFKLIQSIAKDILTGKIGLSKKEYNLLIKVKSFLIKLAEGLVSKLSLQKHIKVVKNIIKIFLTSNEICRQVCIGTCGKVGKNKRKRSASENVSNTPNKKHKTGDNHSDSSPRESSVSEISESSSEEEEEEGEEEEINK